MNCMIFEKKNPSKQIQNRQRTYLGEPPDFLNLLFSSGACASPRKFFLKVRGSQIVRGPKQSRAPNSLGVQKKVPGVETSLGVPKKSRGSQIVLGFPNTSWGSQVVQEVSNKSLGSQKVENFSLSLFQPLETKM